MPNLKLRVAMLGPAAVGKTSLLAVMYKFFNQTTAPTELRLSTDPESEAILEARYQDLLKLIENFDATDQGITATEEPRDFSFTLDRKDWLGKRESLELEFIDVPGEYLAPNASAKKQEYYRDVVSNSGAVIVTIDTLALMKGGGRFNEQVNQVKYITELIETAYQNISEPRLVIFAPVKCETFLQAGKNQAELGKAIKAEYERLITKILAPKVKNVAAVITPVETIGCVVCGGWEEEKGRFKRWYLNKIHVDDPMQTRYADQPLRYLLLFLIKQYIDNQKGLWSKFNDFLQRYDDLKEALRRFASGCRKVTPFEILQGHDFFRIHR
ncbi:TRAFAC clade GTPase domain-containing protein [Capilliphycus salinus ALCB114379]|uniref:TRAFAC clade GTPase domain-containing protein n=1 Tax=Capilliphycus salinus TaxID=2768948 RepID=UPI0039A53A41